MLTEVIRNTQYELIREKCFDEWLEPVPDSPVDLAWVNWFNRNFEATTQLKARLYRIREELRKLRV